MRFPEPASYESTPKARAYRALRAAERVATRLDHEQHTHTHGNTLNEIDWFENMWDDSLTTELGVYVGNWNRLDVYNHTTRQREDLPGGEWPALLAARLERLGAECVWSDEHSACGTCARLIRTECDSFSWTPDFYITHGEITCLGCLLDHIEGEGAVIEGCAAVLWATVWADIAEESGTYQLSGCDITAHMPAIPELAYELASKVMADMLLLNGRAGVTVGDLLTRALRADIASGANSEGIPHFDVYATRFGECMAYAAMGAGVSWGDDHADVGPVWSSMYVTGTHRTDTGHVPPGHVALSLEELAAESLGAVYSDGEGKWVAAGEAV